ILSLLEPYFNYPSSNAVLNQFNALQEHLSPDVLIWDLITDAYLLDTTENAQQSYVLESKLAVILDKIQELQALVNTEGQFVLPYLKIMLVVDLDVATQRISHRETNPVTTGEVKARTQFDWQRYSLLYHHTDTGAPLTEHDLVDGSYVIDTSALSQEE